jgi:hypothetical protein
MGEVFPLKALFGIPLSMDLFIFAPTEYVPSTLLMDL